MPGSGAPPDARRRRRDQLGALGHHCRPVVADEIAAYNAKLAKYELAVESYRYALALAKKQGKKFKGRYPDAPKPLDLVDPMASTTLIGIVENDHIVRHVAKIDNALALGRNYVVTSKTSKLADWL